MMLAEEGTRLVEFHDLDSSLRRDTTAGATMTEASDTRRILVTPAQRRFASWTADVLVYVVVLNLFVEWVDAVVIDSFTISILTAVLLKVLLDAVFALEHRVRAFFERREGAAAAIGRILAVWAILFGSKLALLEIEDLVFGDEVELGGLVEVILLVVALMAARELFARVYARLGERAA